LEGSGNLIEVPFWNVDESSGEKHERPQSGLPVLLLGFEANTSGIGV
jgi:hypothetical protein